MSGKNLFTASQLKKTRLRRVDDVQLAEGESGTLFFKPISAKAAMAMKSIKDEEQQQKEFVNTLLVCLVNENGQPLMESEQDFLDLDSDVFIAISNAFSKAMGLEQSSNTEAAKENPSLTP